MHNTKILSVSLSDGIMRFVIITAAAVMCCGLTKPVEGVVDDTADKLAEMRNCLKAINEVQTDPTNMEKIKAFTTLCASAIGDLDLSESQRAVLEQIGLKSKKSNDKVEEKDKIEEKDKAMDESTSEEKQKVKEESTSGEKHKAKDESVSEEKHNVKEEITSGKKHKAKDESISEEKHKVKDESSSGEKHKAKDESVSEEKHNVKDESTPGKKDKAQEESTYQKHDAQKIQEPQSTKRTSKSHRKDTSAQKKEDKKRSPVGTKTQEMKVKTKKSLKSEKAFKQDPKSSKHDEMMKETVIHYQDEKIPESVPITETEEQHTDATPNVLNEHEQNQDTQIPPLDFSIFQTPEMAEEDIAALMKQVRELQKEFREKRAQRKAHMHASFPDTTVHERAQFDFSAQFGEDIPHFQHHEFRAELFQDPAFGEGIPQQEQVGAPFQQVFPQRERFQAPFEQGIPPFPHEEQFGAPFEQGIPSFPQQEQFEETFHHHQHFHQGMPEVPPLPEWEPDFPNQKFDQAIPKSNIDGAAGKTEKNKVHPAVDQQAKREKPNVLANDDGSHSKRKVDEL